MSAGSFASLDGKVALVTGASRGIGRAIALELGRAGASVVLSYHTGRDEAEAVAKEIGGRAVEADVSDSASAKALVEEAGELDILVNNAGLTRDGVLARMSDDDWRAVIETNLSSVFYTCRAAARPMMKRRAGAIVNVSSIVGVHGNWGQTNYAASKAGIIGFTKSLARELGSRNVRANVVAPGYVRTRLTDVLPEEATKTMLDATPARPARRPGGRGRRGAVPLLRRGVVRHGRGAPRRRRARDVAWPDERAQRAVGASSSRASGMVTPLGNDAGVHMGEPRSRASPAPARSRSSTPPSTPVRLRVRGEGLRRQRPGSIDKATRRMDRFSQLALAAARHG